MGWESTYRDKCGWVCKVQECMFNLLLNCKTFDSMNNEKKFGVFSKKVLNIIGSVGDKWVVE